MIHLANTAKKHFLNLAGKRLDKKFIVFESDDWGSERIPSKAEMDYLNSCGIDIYKNPFNHLDSLETGDDLSALFETLRKFRDSQGKYPVITANCVTANPDFEKIGAAGFSDYFYESVLKTYNNKKECMDSYALVRNGIDDGIFHPQFHGREHLNVRQWLKGLQDGDKTLHNAFKAGIYSIDLESDLTKRSNFMAAFDSNSDNESADHKSIIREGTSMFNDIFGYSSSSFIAPCYVWKPSLEADLKESGIKYLQGLPVQIAPDHDGNYRKIYHFQGQRNKIGQIFFVRNCFFEPSLNPQFNWIEDCLKRIKIIFFWGKPAIIGTHRINYIGSLNEDNRKRNLNIFNDLLKMILKSWPDVEFTTTDKLGELY